MSLREKYKVQRKYMSNKANSSFISHYKRLHIEAFSFKEVEISLITHAGSSPTLGICNPYWVSTLPLP